MGNQYGGNVLPAYPADGLVAQVAAQVGVEAGKGFVQQQQVGLRHQCAGQCEALLFAAGQAVHAAFGFAAQADFVQGLPRPLFGLFPRHFAHLEAEGCVLPYVEMRKQGVVLEH